MPELQIAVFARRHRPSDGGPSGARGGGTMAIVEGGTAEFDNVVVTE